MVRFLTVFALIACIGGLAGAAELDVTGDDPLAAFINNIVEESIRDLGVEGTTWGDMVRSVDLGGYLRIRYESSEIESIQRIFGPSPTGPSANLPMVGDDWADWVAYKALFSAKFELGQDIVFYGSAINMNVLGENGRFDRTMPAGLPGSTRLKSPQISDPEVAAYEGFMSWENFLRPGITAKVGRQELVYGNQWLLSNNEFYGGLTFDAGKLAIQSTENCSIDVFGGQVASMYAPAGPSRPRIYGAYAKYRADLDIEEGDETELDFYLLYNTDNMNVGDLASRTDFARERRYTAGSRLAGYFLPDVDYSVQGALQLGHTATAARKGADVEAYAGELEVGKTWPQMQHVPRVALRVSYASGDSTPDNKDATAFNPLYQNPHGQHGLADIFHFTNLVDYAVVATMTPGDNWLIGAEGHILRTAERPPGGAKALGQELDLFAKLKATDNFSVTLAWSMFVQGKAFKEATDSREHDQRLYLNMVYSF